jgi:hypothetical protein
MSETRLTNVVVPEVFTAYALEPSIYKSRFFKSGVVVENPGISALLAGGGTNFQMPFWQDTAGGTGDVPSETVATTVNNATTGNMKARRQLREKAWGANDLSAIFAGEDPIGALTARVGGYWSQAFDQIAIMTFRGVIADNIANDSGDLVNDISGNSGGAAIISDSAVIDAQAKLGENGTVGEADLNGGGFAAILVHPSTYAVLRKNDLIDFVPVSGQERPLQFYMGMRVIVDRNAYVNSTVYDSYILKAGALNFGQSNVGYIPTEVYRNPTVGFGIDNLYTRRVFAMHPVGFQWTDNTVTGSITPSDANLVLTANWNRVYNAENSGIVVLRHKIA